MMGLLSRTQATFPMVYDPPDDQRDDHRIEAMEEVAELRIAVPPRAELLADIGKGETPGRGSR